VPAPRRCAVGRVCGWRKRPDRLQLPVSGVWGGSDWLGSRRAQRGWWWCWCACSGSKTSASTQSLTPTRTTPPRTTAAAGASPLRASASTSRSSTATPRRSPPPAPAAAPASRPTPCAPRVGCCGSGRTALPKRQQRVRQRVRQRLLGRGRDERHCSNAVALLVVHLFTPSSSPTTQPPPPCLNTHHALSPDQRSPSPLSWRLATSPPWRAAGLCVSSPTRSTSSWVRVAGGGVLGVGCCGRGVGWVGGWVVQ